MKIAMLQLNFLVGDFQGNAQKILDGYQRACQSGADLVVTSELALWGYPPRDLLLSQDHLKAHDRVLRELMSFIKDVGLVIGISEKIENNSLLHNSAVLIQNGQIIYRQEKSLLPAYDVFDETRYFAPCNHQPQVFTYCGKRCAMLVCEDIWGGSEDGRGRYPSNPIDQLMGQGVEVLIVINGSPYFWGKGAIRLQLVTEIAKKLNCVVVYDNQVGGNDELIFDGRSFAVNNQGNLLTSSHSFSECLILFDSHPTVKNIVTPEYSDDSVDIGEMFSGLVLGLQDYVIKTGFEGKGVVVASSGGIDSAVVAAIATIALGGANVLTIGMPSDYSSQGSVDDAKQLAKNLGAKFEIAPIGSIHQAFQSVLFSSLSIDASNGNLTEQNLQARVRGTLVMAVSNAQGRLVLSTGNKSEISVGYCTLYGDMCGGLGVISDVPKTVVYDLAKFINSHYGHPIPENIISKAPSAELKPNQKDADDLPPYEVLDKIIHAYVEHGLGVDEIVSQTGVSKSLVLKIIAKINKNEFKRRQAAPGLKITSKAFGSGRRMPMAAKF